MDDLEFYKECCNYIGYEVIKETKGFVTFGKDGVNSFIYDKELKENTQDWKEWIYPTLLQKAIEGVNEHSDLFNIDQSKSNITVIPCNYPVPIYFEIDPKNIINVKRLALEYVFENERNKEN